MKYLLSVLAVLAGIGITLSVEAKPFVEEQDEVTESVVLFSQDKSKVSVDGIKKLRSLSKGKVEITGFASSEGDAAYNLALSKRRADAIHLIMGGPAIVNYVGEETASTPVDSKDRKVVIRVTTTELAYSPIFVVDGILQGVVSHQLYNVIPVR